MKLRLLLDKQSLLIRVFWFGAFIFSFFLMLFMALSKVLSGNISFWYDPARDMLAAWDTLHKVTLIGPPSGIPGIFYGPYWIWLLSLGLLFSKDPRFVVLLSASLLYFFVLPFFLYRFSKIFGHHIVLLLWILFMYSTGFTYATELWNPYPASLLLVILINMLTFTKYEKSMQSYLSFVFAGSVTGLLANFHISFGIGILLGSILFFIIDMLLAVTHVTWDKKRQVIMQRIFFASCFIIGVVLVFFPFFFFEFRHGFSQIQMLFATLQRFGNVVTVTGLNKMDILRLFFDRLGVLLHVPSFVAYLIEIVLAAYVVKNFQYKKFMRINEEERRLLLFLFTSSVVILFLYLTARNPVWNYHFIGVEVLFLFIIGCAVKYKSQLKTILFVWAIFLIFSSGYSFLQNIHSNPNLGTTLFTEEQIVSTIAKDADKNEYTVFDYSPSIYTYEYSYLFKWIAGVDIPYDPGKIVSHSKLVYLILPTASHAVVNDFIHYRTPDTEYATVKTWKMENGVTVLKRMLEKKDKS